MSDVHENPDPDLEALIRAAVGRLGESGQRCGLYMGAVRVAVPEDGPGPALVIADFAVGELAFTERVLNPAGEEDRKTLRGMDVDLDLDRFLEARRRMASGEGPLGELEDDDE